ncbi:HNH endonuclease [Gordonia phage Jalebi]|uniref:HNH endonuclease n=1 Tax=Gordonia phage Jalebi TaxID=2910757 RepID=A0AA49BNW2_9CAUD|nr:HNH endonuclease [Gordonia phage Jalebi]WNM69444.1 HNH endonuclease [Gordonia phage Sampudon]
MGNDCIDSDGPNKGYGYARAPGGGYAHREAWIQAHGPIPKGMVIRHTCHNRRCINVDHLLLGTYKENTQDMFDANRQAKQNRVITDEIIARYANGESTANLAQEIGVHRNAISRAARDRGVRIGSGKYKR